LIVQPAKPSVQYPRGGGGSSATTNGSRRGLTTTTTTRSLEQQIQALRQQIHRGSSEPK
jgi:hypothetical protein